MKPAALSLCALFAVTGAVQADVPRKQPLAKYQRLWDESPFTAKPVAGPAQEFNPLENYVLLGVAAIDGGYRVTLLNKKKPTDPRIVVETNRPAEGFEIIQVIHKQGDPLGAVVQMKSGSTRGTVAFEGKFLELAASKVAEPPKSNAPAAAKTVATSATSTPPRAARPRILPKPVPTATPATQ